MKFVAGWWLWTKYSGKHGCLCHCHLQKLVYKIDSYTTCTNVQWCFVEKNAEMWIVHFSVCHKSHLFTVFHENFRGNIPYFWNFVDERERTFLLGFFSDSMCSWLVTLQTQCIHGKLAQMIANMIILCAVCQKLILYDAKNIFNIYPVDLIFATLRVLELLPSTVMGLINDCLF